MNCASHTKIFDMGLFMDIEIRDFPALSGPRLGWKTIRVNSGPEIEISDTEMHILDKEDQAHVATVTGALRTWGSSIIVYSSLSLAESYLENKEYILTDGQLRIPRCNIKSVQFKEVNHRTIQPTEEQRGVPDWDMADWRSCIFVVGGCTIILCFALALWTCRTE